MWDPDDDPAGNAAHIAKHRVSKEEVEEVLDNPEEATVSRETGRPAVFGETRRGRYLFVAYDLIDERTAYPVTAYDVPRRGAR